LSWNLKPVTTNEVVGNASTWKDTIWKDVEPTDTAWDDVCLKAVDRDEWKECVGHWKD